MNLLVFIMAGFLSFAQQSTQKTEDQTKMTKDKMTKDAKSKHHQMKHKKHQLKETMKESADRAKTAHDRMSYLNDTRYGAHLHLLALPHIGSAGLDMQLNRKLTFAFDYMPFSISTGDFSANLTAIEFRTRYHVWGRRFFLAFGLGQQSFSTEVTTNITYNSVTIPTKFLGESTSLYMSPHIGWLSRYSSGFFMQFEFGARVPVSVSSSSSITPLAGTQSQQQQLANDTEYQKLNSDLEDIINKFGKSTIPYFSALTIGWLF